MPFRPLGFFPQFLRPHIPLGPWGETCCPERCSARAKSVAPPLPCRCPRAFCRRSNWLLMRLFAPASCSSKLFVDRRYLLLKTRLQIMSDFNLSVLYDSGALLTRISAGMPADEWEMEHGHVYWNAHVDKVRFFAPRKKLVQDWLMGACAGEYSDV